MSENAASEKGVHCLPVSQHLFLHININAFTGSKKDLFKDKDKYCKELTLKAPRKTASENVVCLCRLLNILADFSNLFLHTGKQCGP